MLGLPLLLTSINRKYFFISDNLLTFVSELERQIKEHLEYGLRHAHILPIHKQMLKTNVLIFFNKKYFVISDKMLTFAYRLTKTPTDMKKNQYVLFNYGEYVADYDNYTCSWTCLPQCAKVFDTYAKARYAKNKINHRYGFERCTIEKL